jgi:Pin2-interacting protein X1
MASDTGTTKRQLYQGVERDGFGMRMLASMGWQEGKGVGKNGNGLAKHLHAKKRAMNSGIGSDVRVTTPP